MLDKDFIAKNKGRMCWLYTACRVDTHLGTKQLVQTFFDEDKAQQYCDDMNIHPQFGKFYKFNVEKTKIII